jgi:hypothetical protein
MSCRSGIIVLGISSAFWSGYFLYTFAGGFS